MSWYLRLFALLCLGTMLNIWNFIFLAKSIAKYTTNSLFIFHKCSPNKLRTSRISPYHQQKSAVKKRNSGVKVSHSFKGEELAKYNAWQQLRMFQRSLSIESLQITTTNKKNGSGRKSEDKVDFTAARGRTIIMSVFPFWIWFNICKLPSRWSVTIFTHTWCPFVH